MADRLRVELSQTDLVASPGGTAAAHCTVYNASLIVDEYALRIGGVDPSWVSAPAGTPRIFPERAETVAITFSPRARRPWPPAPTRSP